MPGTQDAPACSPVAAACGEWHSPPSPAGFSFPWPHAEAEPQLDPALPLFLSQWGKEGVLVASRKGRQRDGAVCGGLLFPDVTLPRRAGRRRCRHTRQRHHFLFLFSHPFLLMSLSNFHHSVSFRSAAGFSLLFFWSYLSYKNEKAQPSQITS